MSTGDQGSAGRGRLLRAAVVMVCALLILVGVFAFTLENNAATASVTSQVHASFARHLADFSSENMTALSGDYAPGARLEWVGETRGLGGSYNSTSLIGKFYSGFFSRFTSVSVKNVTYSVQVVGGGGGEGGATVNGTIVLLGSGPQVQTITGDLTTSVAYVHVNGGWEISSETWDFVSLYLEAPLD